MTRFRKKGSRQQLQSFVFIPDDPSEKRQKVVMEVMPSPPCMGSCYCCVDGPCIVSMIFYPKAMYEWTVCPALLWDGHRHWCGLYTWRRLFQRLGWLEDSRECISPQNPWRREPLRNRTVVTAPPDGKMPYRMLDTYAWIWQRNTPAYLAPVIEEIRRRATEAIDEAVRKHKRS
jgi:hypothetical protein